MVEVKHRPIKEIVVYECVKYESPEDLARAVAIEAGTIHPASLRWANGIVFKLSIPDFLLSSDVMTKEFIEGRLYVSLGYSDMPEFSPKVHSKEERVIVPVLDESSSEIAQSITKWVREREG